LSATFLILRRRERGEIKTYIGHHAKYPSFFTDFDDTYISSTHFRKELKYKSGPGSSVGITAGYGLDGPGSNPGGDEIFRPARPALGTTQPPVKWVPGLSRG